MVEYNNQYWRRRKTHGRPRRYNAEEIEHAFFKYWYHVTESATHSVITGKNEHQVGALIFEHLHPMSMNDFFGWLSIAPATWRYWKINRPDLQDIIRHVERRIFEYKFDGVRAGQFPPACIHNAGDFYRAQEYRMHAFKIMKIPEYARWEALNKPRNA